MGILGAGERVGSVGRETMPPERGIAAEGSKEWHTDTVDGKAAEKNAFCYWRKEQHNLAMNEGTNDRHIKIKSTFGNIMRCKRKEGGHVCVG